MWINIVRLLPCSIYDSRQVLNVVILHSKLKRQLRKLYPLINIISESTQDRKM